MQRRPDLPAAILHVQSSMISTSQRRIATPTGEISLAELQVGSRVITRDHGVQEVRWIGRRTFSLAELDLYPQLLPVKISAGALGPGLPDRDMRVSPNTRVLVKSDDTALYFEDNTLLVQARNLVGLDGIDHAEPAPGTYVHITFEQHEVVRENGIWIERFHPGLPVVSTIGEAQQAELFALFPELHGDPVRPGQDHLMAGSAY